MNQGYLQSIVPSPDLAWFAADAGRALYVLGRYEQANAWLQLVQPRAVGDPQAAAAASALAVYARIAGVGAPLAWDPASLAAWRQANGNSEGAQRLLAVFDGLGEPLGGGLSMVGQPASADGSAGKPPDPTLLPLAWRQAASEAGSQASGAPTPAIQA